MIGSVVSSEDHECQFGKMAWTTHLRCLVSLNKILLIVLLGFRYWISAKGGQEQQECCFPSDLDMHSLVPFSLYLGLLNTFIYLSDPLGILFYDPVREKLCSLSRFLTQANHLSAILLPGASNYVADTVDCHFLAKTASHALSISFVEQGDRMTQFLPNKS